MDFRQLMLEERRRAAETKSSILEKTVTCIDTKKTTTDQKTTSLLPNAPLKVWTKRSSPIDIEKFRKGPIPGIYYIPNWITEDEEEAILEQVYAISDQNEIWVKLKHRRLQMWGGEVKTPFVSKPLPQWLMQISQALVDTGIFSEEKMPNHTLINEYGVGDFIMPHEDGPAYFPLVAIISTGTDCRVTFEPHRAATDQSSITLPSCDFQLECRSLLVFTGEAYTRYLHSIDNIQKGTRISLTIRHVHLH